MSTDPNPLPEPGREDDPTPIAAARPRIAGSYLVRITLRSETDEAPTLAIIEDAIVDALEDLDGAFEIRVGAERIDRD